MFHRFIKKPLFPALHEMGKMLLPVMVIVFPEMKKHDHAPARIPARSPVSKDTPKGQFAIPGYACPLYVSPRFSPS
ncbi:hypothetical protein, partial [Atribacter sp.]|uniref:hypothetical protein n=1 Tax=Atribacter sp. TaxID=2847780 RepID=UPI002D1FA58A